jgi:hypothetical protein
MWCVKTFVAERLLDVCQQARCLPRRRTFRGLSLTSFLEGSRSRHRGESHDGRQGKLSSERRNGPRAGLASYQPVVVPQMKKCFW